MNLNTLKTFRQQVYGCMERRADALFSVCDGLLSEPQARSLPELAHSPFFERQWPSVYAALADGKMNLDELRALCVRQVLADVPADAQVWISTALALIRQPLGWPLNSCGGSNPSLVTGWSSWSLIAGMGRQRCCGPAESWATAC